MKKIRLNTIFSELEDNFGISLSYANKIFAKNIPIIASVFRPFVVDIDAHSIRKNRPISFRHNFYDVKCIIDWLEIDIQKPSGAVKQALTWYSYKNANTIKFLISCTPNGLINYLSPAYSGLASDLSIIEDCNFVDKLKTGDVLLTDRGFKHVEPYLNAKGIRFKRPPSVAQNSKLTKAEVKHTKRIASLRIHIERAIGRVQEFYMLKQHSMLNVNTLFLIEDILIIACGLINIQDYLIK